MWGPLSAFGPWDYESEVAGTHFDKLVAKSRGREGVWMEPPCTHCPWSAMLMVTQLELETWGSDDFRRILVGCLTETMKG